MNNEVMNLHIIVHHPHSVCGTFRYHLSVYLFSTIQHFVHIIIRTYIQIPVQILAHIWQTM